MTSEKTTKRDYWLTIIEWDGQQPPTIWYDRLERLIGSIRRTDDPDRTMSAIQRRRKDEDAGVIVQEGVILCSSQSLARAVAHLARFEIGDYVEEREGRRPQVFIGPAGVAEVMTPDPKDLETLGRIRKVLGRRGRPPKAVPYAITCLECLETYEVETHSPLSCPHCRGLSVHIREGARRVYLDSGELDVVDLWVATRFNGAHLETSRIVEEAEEGSGVLIPSRRIHAIVQDVGGKERPALDLILSSQSFKGFVRRVAEVEGRDRALLLLDAVLISRAHYAQDKRKAARGETLITYWDRGGELAPVSLFESTFIDLLDLGAPLGTEEAVGYLIREYDSGGIGGGEDSGEGSSSGGDEGEEKSSGGPLPPVAGPGRAFLERAAEILDDEGTPGEKKEALHAELLQDSPVTRPHMDMIARGKMRRKRINMGVDWVVERLDASVDLPWLEVRGKRGYRSSQTLLGEMQITQYAGIRTVVHELGHVIEAFNGSILSASVGFLKERAKGVETEKLSRHGRGYHSYERTRADNFTDAYMGKIYGSLEDDRIRATEILSMGLQELYEDPVAIIRKDPELVAYVVDVMSGRYTRQS